MIRFSMLALAALLTACGSDGDTSSPPSTVTSVVTSTSTVAPTSSSTPPPDEVPTCASLVGERTADVVDPEDGPQCITGESVESDNTAFSTTPCTDTQTGRKVTAYSWSSQDPDPVDTSVYVARSDGRVRVIEGRTAGGFPVTVADIVVAVHCV